MFFTVIFLSSHLSDRQFYYFSVAVIVILWAASTLVLLQVYLKGYQGPLDMTISLNTVFFQMAPIRWLLRKDLEEKMIEITE